MLNVITLDAAGDANRSYVIANAKAGTAWCVDPSYAGLKVLDLCHQKHLRLTDIFLTHTHGDHVATLALLQKATKARTWVNAAEKASISGATASPGEGPMPGLQGVEAIFTPGHTPGGTCYRVGNALFTGDVLFVDWVGRSDFPGGDPAALFASLAKLRGLDPSLMIHPGHHYGSVEKRTLGEEVRLNKFLACDDFEHFLRLIPELAG